MKRLLVMITALIMAVSNLNAIDAGNGQMWWGYFSGTESVSGLGTRAPETFDCAIRIAPNQDIVGGSTIKALRIMVLEKNNLSAMKVWISKALPANADAADYVQDVKINALANGFNDIELEKPYAVNNEEVYVGFSITVKGATYDIPVGGNWVANSLYLKSSVNITSWSPLSSYGKLAMKLLLEGGEYPANAASPYNFRPAVVELGKTVDVPVKITNNGGCDITNLSYTITTNGVTSAENSINVPAIGYKMNGKVNIPMPADAVAGTQEKTITITKVNGLDNNDSKTTATGELTTMEEVRSYPRTVLVEEFTTEYCGYCPDAAATLATFLKNNPDLAEQITIAAHHAGYYTDWLTVTGATDYCTFYNDGGNTYAPAFMYDRTAQSETTPVVNYGNHQAYIEDRLTDPAYAYIDLKAEYNSDKTEINVTADCERWWTFAPEARITIFLTEDNVKAKSQASGGSNFIHQHVTRAINSTWGVSLNWENNKAQYTYKFNVDPTWKTEDLKVIAFIANYDKTDVLNREVENAAMKLPKTPTGIENIVNEEKKPLEIYSIDGRKENKLQPGMNIVKMSNGAVKKIMVK